MIITCTKLMSTKNQPELSGWSDANGYITIGNSYVVYAYKIYKDIIWYLICDDNYGITYDYPLYLPDIFFMPSDKSASKYWIKTSNGLVTEAGFTDIINNSVFYEDLTDGDAYAINKFKHIKSLIDTENGYGENMFIYREMPPINDGTCIIHIPSDIKDKQDLINYIVKNLSFHFEEITSWDTLSYFISHMEWIKEKKLWINHDQLPSLQKNDLKQYIKCLNDACESLKYSNHQYELTVYFPKNEENATIRLLA